MTYPIIDLELGKYRRRDVMAEREHDRLVRLVTANSKRSSKRTGMFLVLGSLVLSTFVLTQMFIS